MMLGMQCRVSRGMADRTPPEEGDVARAGVLGSPALFWDHYPSPRQAGLPSLSWLGSGMKQGAVARGGCVLAAGAVVCSLGTGTLWPRMLQVVEGKCLSRW